MNKEIGRNDPCPCNSGKKYKRCCQPHATASVAGARSTEMRVIDTIQVALEYYSAGQLAHAEVVCQKILNASPGHPDGLHLSGMIAGRMGKKEIAVELIGKAISIKPSCTMYYNLASLLHDLGRLDAAVEEYRQALALKPDFAEAHCNLGLVFKDQGNFDAAIDSFRQALALKPDFAEAHSNLGLALKERGDLDAAIKSCRRALVLKPNLAEAYNNLGNALKDQGKLDEAVTCYLRAVNFKPDLVEAYNNLGFVLQKQGKLDGAISCYQKAIMHDPNCTDAHENLGFAFRLQGKLDEAVACYRKVLELTPGNESMKHLIASLTGVTSERAPSQYVEGLFDDYADEFDVQLVKNLEYKIPIELMGLAKKNIELPVGRWDVLDLGCGTGLAGVEISPHARQLVGVDLSTKMLSKARARNIYQRLVHEDLLSMMRGEGTSSYDVIIATDVLVYLGVLDAIFSEARRLLRDGGFFMFSAEGLDAFPDQVANIEDHAGYKLTQSGRYTHSSSYLKKLASTNGFEFLDLVSAQVRLENGRPAMGWLALCRVQ